MIEYDLTVAVKKVLEDEILSRISIFDKGEMKVYLQDIPLSEDYEDEDGDDKYLPCCVVRLSDGTVKTAADAQETTVEIITCIKDDSEDMSGYQTLLVIIDRIRDYFTANCGINLKFRLKYPIEWYINREAAPPYFVSSIVTRWETAVMPYYDEFL